MRDDGAPVRVALLHAESGTHSCYVVRRDPQRPISRLNDVTCGATAQEYIWSALQKMGKPVELLLVVDPPSPA